MLHQKSPAESPVFNNLLLYTSSLQEPVSDTKQGLQPPILNMISIQQW